MKKYIMEKSLDELKELKKEMQKKSKDEMKELNKIIKEKEKEEEKRCIEEEQKRHIEELENFYEWANKNTLTHTDNATGEQRKMTVLELYQEEKKKKRTPINPTQQN